MTHSLHREGSVESLERDYCMLIYPARGWNTDGVTPKLQHLLELVFLEDPSNLLVKTLHKNKYSGVTKEEMSDSVRDNSRVFCVFNRRESLVNALKGIKAADEGISIIVTGLIDGVREICEEVGLDPHTINLSLGVHGQTDLLPPSDIRQYTTMCGHGMVSPGLIRDAIRQVKTSKLSAWEMSIVLAKPCACGIYNPHRSEELLKEMAPLYTVTRW
jgi:hypothetical protein